MKSYRPSPIWRTLYMYIMKTWEENFFFYIKHHLHKNIIIYMLMMSVIKLFVFLSCWFYWEEILCNNKVNIKIWRTLRSKLNKQTYICHYNIYNIFYNVLDSFPACYYWTGNQHLSISLREKKKFSKYQSHNVSSQIVSNGTLTQGCRAPVYCTNELSSPDILTDRHIPVNRVTYSPSLVEIGPYIYN